MKKDILLRDAYERYCSTKEDSPDHRNMIRGMHKLFGVGEWKDKAYHWPQNIMIHQVDGGMVTDLMEARAREGLMPASVNAEIRNLRRVFNYGLNAMRAKPPEEPFKFKLIKTKDKTRFISLSEEERILAFFNTRQGRTAEVARGLYIFLVDTGVRISEALGVRKKDIDLDDGTVLVWREKTDEPGMPALTPRVREVVMGRLKDCKAPEDHLFQRTNRAIKFLRKALDYHFNQDPVEVKRHGKVTIHTLRHTFASRLVVNEVSLYTVSVLLGHTSTQMSRRYAHLEARTKAKQAAEILSGMSSSNATRRNDV
ncbi:XerC Integrase [uncultured Caudovirales phage]|uniref:Integrase n=1 Tax=uncultured Caudovirales phage TaxID=2100421 RepID=A0A6J5NRC4_9CAUD|nr:XerC Integrase [uncultured Caudovirales phage]